MPLRQSIESQEFESPIMGALKLTQKQTIPPEKYLRPNESGETIDRMCVDSDSDLLVLTFNSPGRVRTLSLSNQELHTQDVYVCNHTGDILGLGYVKATGTLLVYSSEPDDDSLLKDRLVTFAREGNSFNLKLQEKIEHENSRKRKVQFCELYDAKVLTGNCYINSNMLTQNLYLFKVGHTHQIGLKHHIQVPEPFYWFDAKVIADHGTLVALTHHSHISLYEIKNAQLTLNKLYRLSINYPTQVLWCGKCLFVGSRKNSQRLSAISLSGNTLKITTDVQVPDSSIVSASEKQLAFLSGVKGVRFCSIKGVPPFHPTPPPMSPSLGTLHRRLSIPNT